MFPLALAALIQVGPGIYRPTYPASPEEAEIPVAAFRMDQTPVTNAAFLAFVQAHPEWRRDQIKAVFADSHYLAHWSGPTELGPAAPPQAPVVNVSWFVARRYCAARAARLPTEAEWELAAAASETTRDGRSDPEFTQKILDWYAQPTPTILPDVGRAPPNAWGIQDLHGLIWEWVEDFNSTLVSVDNREQGGADTQVFCGAGALKASDKGDYASFMRIAFRSALKGDYTTGTLGFRCVEDL